jgi:dTMP kinase
MKRVDSGLLIAIEGIDGAGKTTQVNLLTDFFTSSGVNVVRSKEPTDGYWGKKIRESAATSRMSLDEELEAFLEDRKEHVRDKVAPALNRGDTVILDRYFYSTIAYQGSRGGDLDEITTRVLENAPEPDVVFLLDVPPEVGLSRIAHGRQEIPNAFETHKDLEAARAVFLDLATRWPNIVVIDGIPAPQIVHQRILRAFPTGLLKTRNSSIYVVLKSNISTVILKNADAKNRQVRS